jgi:endonuclease/exonuclease/phosphatase family metal-dependent hydrolase
MRISKIHDLQWSVLPTAVKGPSTVVQQDMHGQTSIPEFYHHISAEESTRRIRREFNSLRSRHRRQQQKQRHPNGGFTSNTHLHDADATIGAATYNIRGLATAKRDTASHLHGLKERHAHGVRDIVFLQETHLNPHEHDNVRDQYAAMWGFKSAFGSQLSMWSSGDHRKAGVAILVHPHGQTRAVVPWREELWTQNLIMAQGEISQTTFIFVNIYAPTEARERKAFFDLLLKVDFPVSTPLIMGGDFNCVVEHGLDRVGKSSTKDEGSKQLSTLLEKLGLTDANYHYQNAEGVSTGLAKYVATQHTFFYSAGSDDRVSCRLDRFYISAEAEKWVKAVNTEPPPTRSDHLGVLIHLQPPLQSARIHKRPSCYPPPHYAKAVTDNMVKTRILELRDELRGKVAGRSVDRWDQFKATMVTELSRIKQETRKRISVSFRQKIKRLKRVMSRCDPLTTEGAAVHRSCLDQLHAVQDERRTLKNQRSQADQAQYSTTNTKQFFRRICTKFGDNIVPTLRTREGLQQRSQHDKANTLADHWRPIFNTPADNRVSVDDYINEHSWRWQVTDTSDVDYPITETEVRRAIRQCKRDNAIGPGNIGNDWYKDHQSELVPVLTQLFNDMMSSGTAPASALGAYIFSIRKGGDGSDPLNYRPIALLNTDYKLFTRVLAWRVAKYVPAMVHSTQFGFVAWRTIHEAIDLFEAAMTTGSCGEEVNEAQALLLDFAKAYDSLDRGFLLHVLRAKGFSELFCKTIEALHTGTTVRFIANGQTSDPIPVTSGIRQGCPLAPLLFIIAVDVLYDEILTCPAIKGVTPKTDTGQSELRIAGYADDTAIYLVDCSMQDAAIAAVHRFSAYSGLRVNLKKLVAIKLTTISRGGSLETVPGGQSTATQQQVPIVNIARYLGHVASNYDTTSEAWRKAFAALATRLRLAMDKTNTVEQRARIAAAVIVPKLLYTARHA